MSDNDLNSRLERLASEATPSVDGAFVNRLETDLRLQAESSPTAKPAWRGLFAARPATIVATIVLMVGLFGVLRAATPGNELIMAAANATSVSVPGSLTTIPATEGMLLPDGSEIRVGSTGSAVINGVLLEPGSVAQVVDGELELRELPKPTDEAASPAPTTSTSTVVPQPTTSLAPTATTTTTVVRETSTTSTAVEPAPDPERSTTAPPRTTTTTTAPTTTSTTTTTTTTVAPTDVEVDLTVAVRPDGRARLRWAATPTDPVAGWEVQVQRGETVRRVIVIRDPEASRLVVVVPNRAVTWRVLAYSANGEVVGTSEWVGVPRPQTGEDG